MDFGFLPVFRPTLTDDPFREAPEGLRDLLRHIDLLNGAAIERDLSLLTDYADNRPAPDGFDGTPEALDAIVGPWEEWFDPADALRTVSTLSAELEAKPGALGDLEEEDEAALRTDLELLEEALRKAHAAGALFRFEVVQ